MERKVGAFQRMKATFQHIRIFMDWLNARITTSTDPFRIKTTESFAAFGSKHRKFFEVNFSDVMIRNGYEVVAKFLRRGRNPFI